MKISRKESATRLDRRVTEERPTLDPHERPDKPFMPIAVSKASYISTNSLSDFGLFIGRTGARGVYMVCSATCLLVVAQRSSFATCDSHEFLRSLGSNYRKGLFLLAASHASIVSLAAFSPATFTPKIRGKALLNPRIPAIPSFFLDR